MIFDDKVPRKVYIMSNQDLSARSENIQPGIGNFGPKTARNREHRTPHSESQKFGTTPSGTMVRNFKLIVEWTFSNRGQVCK